jgi:hypothetical protein
MPVTAAPSNPPDNYGPDRLRKEYKLANPGKSFEKYLNEGEKKFGKGSMDPIRKGLTPKAPTKRGLDSLPTAKAPTTKKPTPKKK